MVIMGIVTILTPMKYAGDSGNVFVFLINNRNHEQKFSNYFYNMMSALINVDRDFITWSSFLCCGGAAHHKD